MVLVYRWTTWHTTVDQNHLIYSGLALISAPASPVGTEAAAPATNPRSEPGRVVSVDVGRRDHDIDHLSCKLGLDPGSKPV